MADIPGSDAAREVLGEFSITEFRRIRELHFSDSGLGDEYEPMLEMVVESEDRSPNCRMRIHFEGIRGLSLEEFGGGQTRITGLAIDDISDRGWERIYWEVIDFEDGMLKFYARSARIVSVVPAG